MLHQVPLQLCSADQVFWYEGCKLCCKLLQLYLLALRRRRTGRPCQAWPPMSLFLLRLLLLLLLPWIHCCLAYSAAGRGMVCDAAAAACAGPCMLGIPKPKTACCFLLLACDQGLVQVSVEEVKEAVNLVPVSQLELQPEVRNSNAQAGVKRG